MFIIFSVVTGRREHGAPLRAGFESQRRVGKDAAAIGGTVRDADADARGGS